MITYGNDVLMLKKSTRSATSFPTPVLTGSGIRVSSQPLRHPEMLFQIYKDFIAK